MARMHRMKERGAEKANFRQLTHKDIEIVLFAVLILLINTFFWTERKEQSLSNKRFIYPQLEVNPEPMFSVRWNLTVF